MFHLVSYWCIRRTQYITSISLIYNICGGFDLVVFLVGVIILFLVVVW